MCDGNSQIHTVEAISSHGDAETLRILELPLSVMTLAADTSVAQHLRRRAPLVAFSIRADCVAFLWNGSGELMIVMMYSQRLRT